MTVIIRAKCDECGETLTSRSTSERDGWLEVWKLGDDFADEDPLDFCCQTCLVDYFTKEDDE